MSNLAVFKVYNWMFWGAGGNKGATGQSSVLPAARKARPGRTIRPTALLVFQPSLGLASLLTGKCR